MMVKGVNAVVAPAAVHAARRAPDLARVAVLDLHLLPTHLDGPRVARHCVWAVCVCTGEGEETAFPPVWGSVCWCANCGRLRPWGPRAG